MRNTFGTFYSNLKYIKQFISLLFLWAMIAVLPAQNADSSALFQHGVASGDPLADRVIFWTRITASDKYEEIPVSLEISLDSAFKKPVKEIAAFAKVSHDFTVKIDLDGLQPATSYFYRFRANEKYSPIGRTKTAGEGSADQLKFGVVSCNNYQHGYFSAFKRVAEKNDLDAIIHLGDYIYEYFTKNRDPRWPKERIHFPAKEVITLDEYRLRYAQYRLDQDLQEAHRLHPFITIWDDHEAANNSHENGASAHNPNHEGSWKDRLSAAKKAYFEWMPIRDYPDQKIYRAINYGNLVDLIMLDTRLEGRDQQIYNMEDSALFDANRSMLGLDQRNWLLNELSASKAKWKIIGNQVVFAPLYAGHIMKRVEDQFLDIWDGYPVERLAITQHIKDNEIKNVVILTGDLHASLAMNVPLDDWNHPQVPSGYNPITGENAVAVEFATPSISSNNFDEFARVSKMVRWSGMSKFAAKYIENRLLKEVKRDRKMPGKKRWINPHIQFGNFREHGYIVLILTKDKAQADYYFIENKVKFNSPERKEVTIYTKDGESRLIVE